MTWDGIEKYFEDINLDPESPAVLVVSQKINSTQMGLIRREDFVNEWSKRGYVSLLISTMEKEGVMCVCVGGWWWWWIEYKFVSSYLS